MRRAKEKVGELFNCHVNKLSQTIVAGHLAKGHKVVFKSSSSSSSSSSMVRMERGSSMGRKETRKYDEDFSNSILESFKKMENVAKYLKLSMPRAPA